MLTSFRRCLRGRSIAIAGCAILCTIDPAYSREPSLELAKETIKRVPMPSKAELSQAEEEVSAVFKSEIAGATKPAAKRELAYTLIKNAGSEENAATRYALLARARRLAADADDQPLFWVISELLAAGFEGDMLAVRSKSLEEMAKAVKGAQFQADVATMALDMCEQAVAEHNWSVAAKLAALAKSMAGKSSNAELRKSTAARALEIGKLEQQWQAAQAAAEKLKTDPDDPEALLKYGCYLCAQTADWKGGLPLLAKSPDERLAAAAKLDLATPTKAATQIKAGDAWWDAAEADDGISKTSWRKRAAFWYQQADPQAAGLVKLRIDKRLAEIGELAGAGPPREMTVLSNKPSDSKQPTAKQTTGKQVATKQMVITLGKGVKLRMHLIPAGKYWVGASKAPNDADQAFDSPGREVEVKQPFYLGVTEVTQTQWESVMNANPSVEVGPDLPVHRLTWLNCREFLDAANALPGTKKFKLRFPTIVEWEAACRGGADPTMFGFGNDISKLGEYAWYNRNVGVPGAPQPVGKLKPNSFGLYDMHGNVWEFTGDIDPAHEQLRHMRGGSYTDDAKECRTGKPGGAPVTFGRYSHGLRVACDAAPGS